MESEGEDVVSPIGISSWTILMKDNFFFERSNQKLYTCHIFIKKQ